jgi:hypothetical protein
MVRIHLPPGESLQTIGSAVADNSFLGRRDLTLVVAGGEVARCRFPRRRADIRIRAQGFGRASRHTSDAAPSPRPGLAWSATPGREIHLRKAAAQRTTWSGRHRFGGLIADDMAALGWPESPKAKWKFTKAGEDWFCFAGLCVPWRRVVKAFTLLTTDPSPDVAPIPFVDAVFTVATDPTRSPVKC